MNPLDFFVEEYKPSVREAIQRVFKERASDIDAEVLSKNGTQRHYFFNARRILVNGKACVICAGIDMTAHKLAEMKIHEQANLLELARDAIFVRSPDEKIQYWNKGAEELYGGSEPSLTDRQESSNRCRLWASRSEIISACIAGSSKPWVISCIVSRNSFVTLPNSAASSAPFAANLWYISWAIKEATRIFELRIS